MTVPKINEKVFRLKQEIKEWEHNFTKNHGVKPTHEDIKLDLDIQLKYKKYNKYKKELKYLQEKENLQTPRKNKEFHYATPRKSDELATPQRHDLTPHESPSPMKTKEIGPTPQLEGRVLSIFDIPVNSPLSQPPPPNPIVFKTPSKKKITSLFDTPTTTTNRKVQETPSYLQGQVSPVMLSSQEAVFAIGAGGLEKSSQLLRTPDKTTIEFNIEPSPMMSPVRRTVKRKSLFEKMNELTQFKSDVEKYEKDEEDLNKIILEENRQILSLNQEDDEWDLMNETSSVQVEMTQNEKQDEEKDNHERLRKKIKTQKRSTRRRKMKPLEFNGNDELLLVNIHEKLKMLDEEQQETFQRENEISDEENGGNDLILNNLEDDSEISSSSSSSESEEERDNEPVKTDNRPEKFKLLNTNFVRMKIHYKNRGKFRRGRR